MELDDLTRLVLEMNASFEDSIESHVDGLDEVLVEDDWIKLLSPLSLTIGPSRGGESHYIRISFLCITVLVIELDLQSAALGNPLYVEADLDEARVKISDGIKKAVGILASGLSSKPKAADVKTKTRWEDV